MNLETFKSKRNIVTKSHGWVMSQSRMKNKSVRYKSLVTLYLALCTANLNNHFNSQRTILTAKLFITLVCKVKE